MGASGESESDLFVGESALDELRPLRVARVIARLNVGGPAIQASLLTSHLAPPDFDSTLITGVEDEREGNMIELAGEGGFLGDVSATVIPPLGRAVSPLADLSALIQLIRLFWRTRPDVVHTHTAKAGTLGRIAAIATRVPVIVHTFHGNVFSGYFSPTVSRIISMWESLLARFTSAVIAITPSQAGDLAGYGIPRSRIRVLPLGLPLDRFEHGSSRSDARHELGIGEDEIVIGMIARLVPIKDPLLMVEAAAALKTERGPVRLLIVGDGPMREEVTAAATEQKVKLDLLGWRADLENIYPAMDVVALSSRNEGSPVALIEAMAAGRPVAATDVGGVADLLQGGELGGLAAERTGAGLANAISSALETPAATLAQSRRMAIDKFGIDRLAADIASLYDGLAYKKLAKIRRRRR